MSVCSNVPTYTEPICFVSEGDTSETVESYLSYLTDISEKAFRLLVPRYGMVFEEILQRLDQDLEEYKDDEEREREEKKHHLYQLKQQLEHYLQELPVVSFNTGKYDVNAMKVDFSLDWWTVTIRFLPKSVSAYHFHSVKSWCSATQVVDDLISRVKGGEPVDWRYDLN